LVGECGGRAECRIGTFAEEHVEIGNDLRRERALCPLGMEHTLGRSLSMSTNFSGASKTFW
jgi:hypothetical protein